MATTRRVVLRDGALVVLGLASGVGCGKPDDSGDQRAAGFGSGDDGTTPLGDGADGTDEAEPLLCEDPAAGTTGWTALSLADHPELAVVGGGIQVDLEGRKLAVGHYEDGCFAAVDRICTHEGCETYFSSGRFVCPCHGAVFGLDGAAVSGPTVVAVAAFSAIRVDDTVWINLEG
jgi:nitrite reductase/ring-hydroxylating ferredoxin subunit